MPEDILRFISLSEARHREGDRGRTTQYRTRRTDPDYPEVYYNGGRGYVLEHEHQQYLAKLIERSRAEARRVVPPVRPAADSDEAPDDVLTRRPVRRAKRRKLEPAEAEATARLQRPHRLPRAAPAQALQRSKRARSLACAPSGIKKPAASARGGHERGLWC